MEPGARLFRVLLLSGMLVLAGCPVPASGAPPPGDPTPYAGRAYLAVTGIRVSARTVRRHQPFTVKIQVINRGGRAVESFEVQAQANLDTRDSVLSYPIGGREKVGLKPGQSVEIALARPEGLPLAGVYTITVDLRLTEWEPVEDTDRVDRKIPETRITVTDTPPPGPPR